MSYGQNIPSAVRYLLGFIAERESGGNYRVVYANHQRDLPRPITEMSISELLSWQKKLGSRYGSSAAGAYQHIRTTLQAQVTRLGIPLTAAFSPGLQDDLGWDLLRQRGLDDFLGEKKSLAAFGNALAMEWASLPVLVTVTAGGKKRVRGKSWYDGDGLNAAGHKAEAFERALKETLRLHALKRIDHGNHSVVATPVDLPDQHEDEVMNDTKSQWTSKTIIGALLTLVSSLGLLGLSFDPETWTLQIKLGELLPTLLTAAVPGGAVLSWIGRIVAKKAIA